MTSPGWSKPTAPNVDQVLRGGSSCRDRDQQIARYRLPAERGVHTVFVSLPNLAGPAEVEKFAPILEAFS